MPRARTPWCGCCGSYAWASRSVAPRSVASTAGAESSVSRSAMIAASQDSGHGRHAPRCRTKTSSVALGSPYHGPDETFDDLVVEGVHPPAAQQRQHVVLQQGVQVTHRRRAQITLPGLPLGGVLTEPHRPVDRDPLRLHPAAGPGLLPGVVDLRQTPDGLLLGREPGFLHLPPGRRPVTDLVGVRTLRPPRPRMPTLLEERPHPTNQRIPSHGRPTPTTDADSLLTVRYVARR